MRHVLWLGLSIFLVSTAQAQQLEPAQLKVHLAHEATPKLKLSEPAVSYALTPPCIGCRASLRTATEGYAPEPAPPVPAARSVAPVKKPQFAIGDSWKFAGGRTLSVRLTPTPEECAPLVRLSF